MYPYGGERAQGKCKTSPSLALGFGGRGGVAAGQVRFMNSDCDKLSLVEVSKRSPSVPDCGVSWSAEVQGSGGCLIRFDVAFPLKRLIAKREDVLQWAM